MYNLGLFDAWCKAIEDIQELNLTLCLMITAQCKIMQGYY